MSQTNDAPRQVPAPPPPHGRLPIIIDTDVGTEIDDQYAIAMALACPDRFDVLGITGTFFHDDPDSPDECVRQAQHLLQLAGRTGDCPVARGCPPLTWSCRPTRGEAVDLIVETALRHTPEEPLWVVSLGPLSNVASAFMVEPRIAQRVRLVFHSRCRHWDLRFSSFNGRQDPRALRAVLTSRLPLVLFDTGTYLTMEMEETRQRLAPSGPLGAYLHEYRFRNPYYSAPDKGFFDLGDFCWLLEPSLGEWQEVTVPDVAPDLTISFSGKFGRCLRVHQIDNRRARELFYTRLAQYAAVGREAATVAH